MMEGQQDAAVWYAALPGVTGAVAGLIRDQHGRVLLAKPVYKAEWVFVGGTVGQDESPTATLRREIAEELGLPAQLAPRAGRLLVTDWVATQPSWDRPMHSLVFDCGLVDRATYHQINLPADELRSVSFVPVETGVNLLAAHEGRRLRQAVQASEHGTHYYLENGWPPAR